MAKRERLLIWGGGGHGRVVAELVRAVGYDVVGYADQNPETLGSEVEVGGGRVVVLEADLLATLDAGCLPDGAHAIALGIGQCAPRAAASHAAGRYLAPALVHPTATVSPSARLADGVVVLECAIVKAAAVVHAAAIVNSGAIVAHDCEVGAAVHVAIGAVLCGGVHIGPRAWIGAGAVVRQGITIGADAVVGAGAVVIRDVPEGTTVVGNPARILRNV